MSIVESESLILKTYDLAEADKIVLFFTRDHGIIRGVAKGAKRLKSKFGSALEPLSVVRATYFQKEVLELVSIQNVELVNSYFSHASDPLFLEKFAYLTDILVSSLPPQDPNETLYRMVKACIETAAADLSSLDAVSFYYEVWLLKLTGYLPQWKTCHLCDRTLQDAETVGLGSNFELVCGNCRKSSSMVNVTPAERAILADALVRSPADFASSPIDLEAMQNVGGFLKRVLSQTLGRNIVTASTLNSATKAQ